MYIYIYTRIQTYVCVYIYIYCWTNRVDLRGVPHVCIYTYTCVCIYIYIERERVSLSLSLYIYRYVTYDMYTSRSTWLRQPSALMSSGSSSSMVN